VEPRSARAPEGEPDNFRLENFRLGNFRLGNFRLGNFKRNHFTKTAGLGPAF
jgi:hypothetical protein